MIPKIDLHCHLDGSLTQSFVSQYLGRNVTKEELQVRDDCTNLAEYLEKFDLPLLCLQERSGLKQAAKEFLLQLREDNISYVEVRFAPLLSTEQGLNCTQVIESVLEGLEEARGLCGIDYNVIACAMRHHSDEQNMKMAKAAREFLGEGVCALDLAGNEAAFPMESFRELFTAVHKMDMPFTIHAGECGRVENVIEAVACGAKRIGHGIALRGNKEATHICREKRIGIEMCPISNLQTKAVKSTNEYPLNEFLNEELLVSINTDNRTVSNTTIEREKNFIQENYGIGADKWRILVENAIEIAFAKDDVKHKLWKQISES